MKKEFLRGFTMLMLVVTVALATAAVSSANAQTPKRVRANIPFEFVVGNETMQAGEYTVTPANSAGDALLIQGTENGMAAMRLSAPKDEKGKTSARLVFHCYGQRYFLAQIWNGENTGRELVKSNQERAVERELAGIPSKSGLAQSTYEIIEVVAVLR